MTEILSCNAMRGLLKSVALSGQPGCLFRQALHTALHYMDRADALEKRVQGLETLVKRAAESDSPWDILYHEMAKMPDLGPDGPDTAPTPEEDAEEALVREVDRELHEASKYGVGQGMARRIIALVRGG